MDIIQGNTFLTTFSISDDAGNIVDLSNGQVVLRISQKRRQHKTIIEKTLALSTPTVALVELSSDDTDMCPDVYVMEFRFEETGSIQTVLVQDFNIISSLFGT